MKPLSDLRASGDPEPWLSAKATLRFAWRQLNRSAHIKLVSATVLTALLSILDFAAILLMGALGAVIAATLTNRQRDVLPDIDIVQSIPEDYVIAVFGGVAAGLLAAKSLFAWRVNRRVFLFIARRIPDIAQKIYRRYITAPFPQAQALTRSQVTTAIMTGSAALGGSLTFASGIVAEMVLMVTLISLMLWVSPVLFLAALGYFVTVGAVISRVIAKRSSAYGSAIVTANLATEETLSAAIGFAPEIRLYGMADDFADRLQKTSARSALASGSQQVLMQTPRYILESAVIVGLAIVAAIAFGFQNTTDAAFTVALFTLTSARLVPSLLRLNGAWGSLKLATAQTWALSPILRLPEQEKGDDDIVQALVANTSYTVSAEPTPQELVLKNVAYRYPETDEFALSDVNLCITAGEDVALVGATGSGKSTLAMLIAGLIQPTKGTVSGELAGNVRVAVVPQDVYVAADTVRNNIAIPQVNTSVDDTDIWKALEDAQIADVMAALPNGLDTHLGERGVRLSGGEIQRIGLARALYRNPDLLILDEATSNLDALTEQLVVSRLHARASQCTTVTIAHRLATVRKADQVILLENGRVIGSGKFDDMASRFEALSVPARLQGLLAADKDGMAL